MRRSLRPRCSRVKTNSGAALTFRASVTTNQAPSMFNIGFWELFLIVVVGLLFVGPKQLPEVAKLQAPHEGKAFDFTIDRIEPERLFSFRWHPFAIEPGVDWGAAVHVQAMQAERPATARDIATPGGGVNENLHLVRADAGFLVAIYFIILQFFIVTAITLLFSSFSSPIFSAIFAFALFVIGTFSDDLRNFAAIAEGATKWLATGAAWVVPNFSSLNVILQAAHGQHIRGQLILFNTVYSLLYSAAAIALAVIIFERRNLK